MSKTLPLIACFAFLISSTLVSSAGADDAIKRQILKMFPQADTNQDGVLSDAEAEIVYRRALKRYPRADKDGDGALSDDEKKALLRMAAIRARKNSKATTTDNTKKPPSFANVKYGEHERQVFDIWLADSSKPTPLAIYIHGGGFRAGSKEKLKQNELDALLKAGISVAAINYRYASLDTPLPTPHHDARRALQLMRSKASEWNLDKERVAAFGGSAGAQICMWLAFSDEMAKPNSADPIERESTRLTCVATSGGQTTNDPKFWQELITSNLGTDVDPKSFARPLGNITDPEKARIAMWGAKNLEEANEIANRHAALSIVSAGDPPIFMSYGMKPNAKPPADKSKLRGWLVHHVNLGIALKEKTDALGLVAYLKYPGADVKYQSQVEFFVDEFLKK